MNYPLLQNSIHLYSKNKISLIKYWLRDKRIIKILKSHDISIEIFVKKYAMNIIEYYIAVVNKEKNVGNCPAVEELIFYLKDKDISTSELFILCAGFKNSLIEFTYDLKITNLQLEKEINYIYEENFAGMLFKYSESVLDIEKELTKSTNIVDKYVIMSRTDIKGTILSVSQAFCNISGYTEGELIGKTHNIVRHPDTKKEVFEDLWKTIKSGNDWRGELKNLSKNGTYYWVDVIITPNFDLNNNIVSYDAIRQDITSKKELIEQQNILVEQSKAAAMGEMISMIAHQWRQPLQAVSILIQKLPLTKIMDGEITDELLEQVVDGIGTQLEYMSKTIDDFRDFFLPDKPKESICLKDLIERSLEFVYFMIKTDSIKVNINNDENINISVHVNEMVQVLINIFKNSKDAMQEHKIENKEINIMYKKESDYAVIEIEDNAGGIPEEILFKIFEPYYSTKSNKNGTGLGLYMSKTIVEKHCKGKLSVKNSSKGALFRIELPIS